MYINDDVDRQSDDVGLGNSLTAIGKVVERPP